MKENVRLNSMKRAFTLFWHGLTALLSDIANWITVILGMNDDSRYGIFLRRIVGSCFTLVLFIFTSCFVFMFGESMYRELPYDFRFGDDYYCSQFLSRTATYYSREYESDGYVKNANGEKTIRNIHWIAKPLGLDSLVCYSDGKKRGYFDIYTGKPVIEPKFKHAWVFSDGLASVDDNGWIKFIDATGKVVIDPKIPYIAGMEGYVFHNGYCIVHSNRRDRFGMIDRQGNWVLQPEFFSIDLEGKFWILDNGSEKCVLNHQLDTIIPFKKGKFCISEEYISLTLTNHIIQRYSHEGKLVSDFYINDVHYLTYGSDELRYFTDKNYNTDGSVISEITNESPSLVEKVAKCRYYEAEPGWFGLMTADGQVITPPSYYEIKAIGYDRYLCKDNFGEGVILNEKGERIL